MKIPEWHQTESQEVKILTANLIMALELAIRKSAEDGHSDCALVDGWREVLVALRKGECVDISDK